MFRTLVSAWILSLALALTACPAQANHASGPKTSADAPKPTLRVDIQAAQALIKSQPKMLLLDVRTPQEYASGHLPGARNLPVQELQSRLGELKRDRDRPILVYCRTQNRSARAQQILVSHGYKVTLMQGGWSAWSAAGLPSEK